MQALNIARHLVRAVAWAVLSGACLASAAQAQALKPFKVGISSASVTSLTLPIAEAGRLFEKYGLKVDYVSMEGGTRGIQVLLSGEIQVMHVGIAPVIQANAEDAAITIVAASINTIPLALFAQAKFKAGADLKGANIGISTFGSESDIAVSLALKALGVAKQDVTINQLGGSSQRLAALLAGRADAVPLPEPQNALARQKGYTPLIDLAAQKTPWIYDALVVQKSALANTADLERFLKAYIEGVHLGYSDPALVKAVIAKQFKTNDAVVIDATYAEYKRLTPLDTMPSEAGARNAIEQLTAIGIAVKSKDVGNYIDTGPLKRVLADTAWRDTLKSYKVD